MSVHAFVKSGEHAKQVHLVFVDVNKKEKENIEIRFS
jgi:hypothetical protein